MCALFVAWATTYVNDSDGAGRAAEGLEHGGGQGRDDHSARGPTSPERGQLQLRARASDGCAVFATLVATMQMRRDDETRARCVASIDTVTWLLSRRAADRWPALRIVLFESNP